MKIFLTIKDFLKYVLNFQWTEDEECLKEEDFMWEEDQS